MDVLQKDDICTSNNEGHVIKTEQASKNLCLHECLHIGCKCALWATQSEQNEVKHGQFRVPGAKIFKL